MLRITFVDRHKNQWIANTLELRAQVTKLGVNTKLGPSCGCWYSCLNSFPAAAAMYFGIENYLNSMNLFPKSSTFLF